MKKRAHHYVWRKYLQAWTVNSSIWCCTGEKIFRTGLTRIAQRKDFYKLKELSTADMQFIHDLAIAPSAPHLQELNKGWVSAFTLVFRLKRAVEQEGIIDPNVDKLIDEAINNFEEDLHMHIEHDTVEYLDSILKEDISFLETDKGFLDFMHFLSVQSMRTNRVRSIVLAKAPSIPGIDLERIWNVLSHIFATNIGWSFYADRRSFRTLLLKNQSRKELITGDQPVINTRAKALEPPDEIELYYPVSPKLSILVTQNAPIGRSNRIDLDEDDVNKYNLMIVEKSYSQIYASSEEALNEFVDLMKTKPILTD